MKTSELITHVEDGGTIMHKKHDISIEDMSDLSNYTDDVFCNSNDWIIKEPKVFIEKEVNLVFGVDSYAGYKGELYSRLGISHCPSESGALSVLCKVTIEEIEV